MASFPTSAKTFATRSNGQSIDAAHINDLQDEVNAIESGYLGGTARLNSSHSTMVALSVTGGSTFSSVVVVGSSLTVGGALAIENSGGNARLLSSASIVMQIDRDGNGGESFIVQNGGGTDVFTLGEDGALSLGSSGYVELGELSTVSAPAANKVRLYSRDNGAGKTQIVAIFPSGAGQILATEP